MAIIDGLRAEQEQISESTLKDKDIDANHKKLYFDLPAYSPESLGYRLALIYENPQLSSLSIKKIIQSINTLPILLARWYRSSVDKVSPTGTIKLISRVHGRSNSADQIGGFPVVVENNTYAAVSLKGNTFPGDIAQLQLNLDQAVGIRGEGVFPATQGDVAEFTYKAERLAEAGIPSERIIAAFQVSHVPQGAERELIWDSHEEEGKALRNKVVNALLGNQQLRARLTRQELRQIGRVNGSSEAKVRQFIDTAEFVVLLRGMQVNERVRDLSQTDTLSDREKLTEQSRKFIKTQSGNDQFVSLEDISNSYQYLTRWLPKQMGHHLGTWHKKGFVHGYTHAQNWTMAGTLVDLDSLREKKNYNFSDPAAEREYNAYIFYDIFRAILTIDEIFSNLKRGVQVFSQDYINLNDQQEAALVSFIDEYIKTAYREDEGQIKQAERVGAFVDFMKRDYADPHFDSARNREDQNIISISRLGQNMREIVNTVLSYLPQYIVPQSSAVSSSPLIDDIGQTNYF